MSRCQLVALVTAVAGLQPALGSPVPSTHREDVSRRVEMALSRMTSAARAADVGGYMLQIDADRPLLLAEQRAWALNLRKSPPSVISFSLAENAELEFDDEIGSSATADMTLAWTPAQDPAHPERAPKPISVTFSARFEPMFDAVLFPDTRWVFAGVAWDVRLTASDGSRVLAFQEHEQLARELLEVLPGALASAAECFEAEVPTATVKLYPTMELLNASISPGLTAPIAGWNEPHESIKLAAPAMAFGAQQVLLHEAAHVVQFTMGTRPLDAPWWVLEGSAERAADVAQGSEDSGLPGVRAMVQWWADRGVLADFSELAVYDEKLPAGARRAYVQGHHFIAYLDETYSREARNVWLKLLFNGVKIEPASQKAFGQSFEALDQSWRASIAAAANSEPSAP